MLEKDAESRIDDQLEDLGWKKLNKADSQKTGYTKKEKLHNGKEPDYILYVNGNPVCIIEAKRPKIDPKNHIQQAENYSEIIGENQKADSKYGTEFVITSNGNKHCIKDLRRGARGKRKISNLYSPDDFERQISREPQEGINWLKSNDYEETDKELWKHQQEGLLELKKSIIKRNEKTLIQMAPGTGKTRLAMSLCEQLLESNFTTSILYLTDRKSLKEQAIMDLKDYLRNYNIRDYEDYKNNKKGTDVVVENVQKMSEVVKKEEEEISSGIFDVIIVDEAHREVKESRIQGDAVERFDAFEIGLTATPTKGIIERYKRNLAYEYSYPTAVEDDKVAPFVPYVIRTQFTMDGVEKDGKNYSPREIGRNVYLPDTNQTIAKELIKRNETDLENELTLVFAQNIEHANNIKEDFEKVFINELGVEKGFVRTLTSKDRHESKALNDFKDSQKNPKVLIAVGKMKAGVDIPLLKNIVFMRAVKSKTTYNQMAGRGTRKPENGPFRIYDCVGVFEEHKESPLTLDTKEYRTTNPEFDGDDDKNRTQEKRPPITIHKKDTIRKSKKEYPAPSNRKEDWVDEKEYKKILKRIINKNRKKIEERMKNINELNQVETIIKEILNNEDPRLEEPHLTRAIGQDYFTFLLESIDSNVEKEAERAEKKLKNKYSENDKKEWIEKTIIKIKSKRGPLQINDLSGLEFMELNGIDGFYETFQEPEETLREINSEFLNIGT